MGLPVYDLLRGFQGIQGTRSILQLDMVIHAWFSPAALEFPDLCVHVLKS